MVNKRKHDATHKPLSTETHRSGFNAGRRASSGSVPLALAYSSVATARLASSSTGVGAASIGKTGVSMMAAQCNRQRRTG